MSKDILINNTWQEGEGLPLASFCPLTNDMLWQGHQATSTQVLNSVEAARQAFSSWSKLSLSERTSFLQQYKELLERDKTELATLISKEVGKPLWESATEVTSMINKVAISVQSLNQRSPVVESPFEANTNQLTHRPHGVLSILGPYNFPGHLPNGHIVPALLAGNTIVFKPSELTPMVSQKISQLLIETGLPAGVFNLVQGGEDVGQVLLDCDISGVLFTGSYKTGKKIHQNFAGRPEIILALEMGGNNPLIVSEVNDIDAAVYMTIQSAFITAGQRCTCARRLYLPNTQWGDQFIDTLISRTSKITIGPYFQQPEPFMGPVINQQTAEQLANTYATWCEQGGIPLISLQQDKALILPTIVDMTLVKQVADEEYFGPLLQLFRYDSFDEAVYRANQTKYGLAAGLISELEAEKSQFYHQIRAGIVNINKQLTGAASTAPFGGIGYSGNHRASAYYAADFCAYPMASMIDNSVVLPDSKSVGLNW